MVLVDEYRIERRQNLPRLDGLVSETLAQRVSDVALRFEIPDDSRDELEVPEGAVEAVPRGKLIVGVDLFRHLYFPL